MDVDLLRRVPGIELAHPATDVDLAVADALLAVPLPPALVEFLSVNDGARVGDVELFSVEEMTRQTNEGAHVWQLPHAVIIGRAGGGRALVMQSTSDIVNEIDADSWDARTLESSADSPLDLFVRHLGRPIRARAQWWAWPALAAAVEDARRRLHADGVRLTERPIGWRVGEDLPPSLAGFRQAGESEARALLLADDYDEALLGYRPDIAAPGQIARIQWQTACDAIIDSDVRDRVRGAGLAASLDTLGRWRTGDGDLTFADHIRSHALLALIARARDRMAAVVTGDPEPSISRAGRLAEVFLAGHVPVSLDASL